MKKLIALILVSLMLFSMSGCEEIEKLEAVELPPLPTAAPEEETPAPEGSTEEPVSEEESEEPAPMVDERANQTIVNNKNTVLQAYDPAEGTELILTFAYDSLHVYIEGRDAVAEKINEYLSLLDESYYTGNIHGADADFGASGYNMMLELAQDNYGYAVNSGAEIPLEFTSSRTAYVSRADTNIISVIYSTYQYTGGAHGMSVDRAYVFDAASGEELSLDRISSDFDALSAFLVEYMVKAAEEDADEYYSQRIPVGYAIESTEDYSAAFGALLREGSWYFDNRGLVIFSDVYEFGPYAAGTVEFVVPYEVLSDKINIKYLPEHRSGSAELGVKYLSDVSEGSLEITDLVVVDEGGEAICLIVEGAAYDVEICRVDYSEKFFETAQLWYASYLQNSGVQVVTHIPEGMPNLMVSYSDADGERKNLLVTQSGKDGSIILADESISAIG